MSESLTQSIYYTEYDIIYSRSGSQYSDVFPLIAQHIFIKYA